MTTNPKFSIIIPIYNTEKYLSNCLDSIAKQRYNNYEVIMIDDGSTDNSMTICKEYCNRYKNFKLYTQKNSGVSIARNHGLSYAEGDIVIFVDSDDTIDSTMLDEIVNNYGDNELVVFGYEMQYKNCNKKCIQTSDITDFAEINKKIYIDNLGGFICNKAFLRSIISKNNISFNNNINYCEDFVFVQEYMSNISKAKYVNKSLYYYRMRKGSASWNFYSPKSATIFKAYNIVLDRCTDLTCYDHVCVDYLFNYYRLKKYKKMFESDINYNIINNQKKYIKLATRKIRIKFWLCKHCLVLFKILQRIKQFKYKLYE